MSSAVRCRTTVYLLLLTFFFFNDTATTEIYTLSLHDALPISKERVRCGSSRSPTAAMQWWRSKWRAHRAAVCFTTTDRKSTRLNSSHTVISYAVFCLKKKKKKEETKPWAEENDHLKTSHEAIQ